ncbi:NAD(P)-dependent dehydrogenase, short-chain alcohol dehydrogenase family [Sphingobium faniae]|nr:NAD(P)-dependent dehydrogenase, short-chain alcohol dehydrogenase family [Sphingobium faniae]
MSGGQTLLSLFRLDGKVALVTGAASGIGKATARLLADAGATVAIADIDADGARKVADELGEAARAYAFDLRDDQSITAMVAAVARDLGTVDILVNNAGIYPKYPLDALGQGDWQDMQQVNVWGCFVVLRECARLMREKGDGGRIINISSIGGLRTAVNDQIAYNASKAALDSMTYSAALDLAKHDILVNSICPGAVAPLDPKPHSAGHQPAKGPLVDAGRILLRRAATPDEVAAPILMLASAAGGYITGQAIVIDGGFSVS